MAEATGVNIVGVQPEELKFDLTWIIGERPSSSAKLTNPTNLRVCFEVQVSDPGEYEVKPSHGVVSPFESRRINVFAGGLPAKEQREGEIPFLDVSIFNVPCDWTEEDLVLAEKYYHPPPSQHANSHSVIRLIWVDPKIEIPELMNKAVDEVYQKNLGLALEAIWQAIELRPFSSALLCRALVHQLLGQKEEAKSDLREAELAEGMGELAEGMGEVVALYAECFSAISDSVGVPIYTEEKVCAKQVNVKFSTQVTDNQRLDVEVRLTPSIMLSNDGTVEVTATADSLRFKVEKSPKPDDYSPQNLNHFVQLLKIEVRPTGKWAEFPGFGLTKWSPGNEQNPLMVQQGSSHGFTVGMNVGTSPSGVMQWASNKTSGTTFPSHGIDKSTRGDGHAYTFYYKLQTFKDGSSAQNLGDIQVFKDSKIPEADQDGVNYNLSNHAGTWTVPRAIAEAHRNEFEFEISVEATLPAVRRCRKSNPMHLFWPPRPVIVERKLETRRTCAFAIARLKSYIKKSV